MGMVWHQDPRQQCCVAKKGGCFQSAGRCRGRFEILKYTITRPGGDCYVIDLMYYICATAPQR